MKILIQGATEDEIDLLLEHYKPNEAVDIAGYQFWEARKCNHTIFISLTKKGIINATIATTIVAQTFKPDLIINQGCAGGHIPILNLGDIVIGEYTRYINDFKTPVKPFGEGSNSLNWTPHPSRSYLIKSTPKYIELSKQVKTNNKTHIGTIASADTFSRECDRINYLHSCFNHLSEDMESAAVMKVCQEFNIDRIAFRIISNNELTLIPFDATTRKMMQQFVIDFINLIQ